MSTTTLATTFLMTFSSPRRLSALTNLKSKPAETMSPRSTRLHEKSIAANFVVSLGSRHCRVDGISCSPCVRSFVCHALVTSASYLAQRSIHWQAFKHKCRYLKQSCPICRQRSKSLLRGHFSVYTAAMKPVGLSLLTH